MADGSTRPIEQIREGDLVLSRDQYTGATMAKRVTQTSVQETDELVAVDLTDASGKIVETLRATPEHPVFVVGQGFVPLGKVGIGSEIVTRAGPTAKVKAVKAFQAQSGKANKSGQSSTTLVFNFTVEDQHTYFVGKTNGGVWVHNVCTPRPNRVSIPDGDLGTGWNHIDARHVAGNHPNGAGDLFAHGTTREQITNAARTIVKKGTRVSDRVERVMQLFDKRMKINGMRANYRVYVNTATGEVATMFPVLGGGH